jgi:hypothetical protein
MALARFSFNSLHDFAAPARHLNVLRGGAALCFTRAANGPQVPLEATQPRRPLCLRRHTLARSWLTRPPAREERPAAPRFRAWPCAQAALGAVP